MQQAELSNNELRRTDTMETPPHKLYTVLTGVQLHDQETYWTIM